MSGFESYQLNNPEGMVEIKNVDPPQEQQEQMAEFSTPISDLMNEEEMPDPRVVQQQQQQPIMLKAPSPTAAAAKKKRGSSSSSLSPDQMDALLAGAAAVVAFSKPVQEKLVQMVPGASQGIAGMLLTALIAAIIFYFGRKYLVKPRD